MAAKLEITNSYKPNEDCRICYTPVGDRPGAFAGEENRILAHRKVRRCSFKNMFDKIYSLFTSCRTHSYECHVHEYCSESWRNTKTEATRHLVDRGDAAREELDHFPCTGCAVELQNLEPVDSRWPVQRKLTRIEQILGRTKTPALITLTTGIGMIAGSLKIQEMIPGANGFLLAGLGGTLINALISKHQFRHGDVVADIYEKISSAVMLAVSSGLATYLTGGVDGALITLALSNIFPLFDKDDLKPISINSIAYGSMIPLLAGYFLGQKTVEGCAIATIAASSGALTTKSSKFWIYADAGWRKANKLKVDTICSSLATAIITGASVLASGSKVEVAYAAALASLVTSYKYISH